MAKKKTPKTATVETSWERIESWLTENAPEQARSLAEGAPPAQIQKLESQLGVALPKEFTESCGIHDGQTEDCDLIPDGFGTFFLLRVKDIPREWKLWNQLNDSGEFEDQPKPTPDIGVAGDWWNSGWIPFASNGGGDHLCIDLAPAKGGNVGQIIKMQHDHSDRNLLAPSFAAWLNQLADALERGELNGFLE